MKIMQCFRKIRRGDFKNLACQLTKFKQKYREMNL